MITLTDHVALNARGLDRASPYKIYINLNMKQF